MQPVDANQLPDWMANASTRFGVIGDYRKVVPALTSAVAELRQKTGEG